MEVQEAEEEMIGIIFGIIGAVVVLRAAWWLITLPLRVLTSYRRPRVYYYDEFDWWQDNQGF